MGGRDRRLGRTLAFTPAYPADIYSHPQPTAVAVSPNGRLLALSPGHGKVQLWRLRTLEPLGPPLTGLREQDPLASAGGPEDLAFSPDGTLLAASGGAGTAVVVWSLATHQVVERFTPPQGPETHGVGLEFSPDGKTLANGDGPDGALLWNLATHRRELLRIGPGQYVLSLAYSPDGTRLVTGNGNPGRGILWNVTRRPARRIASFPALFAQGWATSVAFSPDGRLFATGLTGVVTLRDARTGHLVRTLDIPNGFNGVLAFSPDSTKLAVLARDGAEVWNIATGTQTGTGLPGASPQASTPGGPGNLRFTPDGHLVVVGPDGLATIWNVDPATWDAAACTIAGRQLTRAEWARFVSTQPYAPVCP